jgi:hypothetical protein
VGPAESADGRSHVILARIGEVVGFIRAKGVPPLAWDEPRYFCFLNLTR